MATAVRPSARVSFAVGSGSSGAGDGYIGASPYQVSGPVTTSLLGGAPIGGEVAGADTNMYYPPPTSGDSTAAPPPASTTPGPRNSPATDVGGGWIVPHTTINAGPTLNQTPPDNSGGGPGARGNQPPPPQSSPGGGPTNNPNPTQPTPGVQPVTPGTPGVASTPADNANTQSLLDLYEKIFGNQPSVTVGQSGGGGVAVAGGTPTLNSGAGGYAIDPVTGLQIDPTTGFDIDPATGQDIVPATQTGSSGSATASSLLQNPAVIWGIRLALLAAIGFFGYRYYRKHKGAK